MAYARPNAAPVVLQTIATGKYAPPSLLTDPSITLGLVQNENNILTVEFVKNTKNVNTKFHQPIDVDSPSRHIFAFHPNPPTDSIDGWKYWHGPNRRGAYSIQYASGKAFPVEIDSLLAKRVHGAGMATIWLLFFPASIFFTRFFKRYGNWIWIHIAIQLGVGFVGVYAFAILIISNLSFNFGSSNLHISPRPHSALGFALLVLLFLQGCLGAANRMSFFTEKWNVDKSKFVWVKALHDWLGRLMLLLAVVQAGLGIDVLYPAITARYYGAAAWAIYGLLVGGWTLGFVGYQFYYNKAYARIAEKAVFIGGKLKKHDIADLNMPRFGKSIAVKTEMRQFTWKDIDQALKKTNELLVVAQGRYVYRINDWLDSHPGGQLILYLVAGTDITNDYFYEAGYDAEQFVPKQKIKSGKKVPDAADNPNRSSLGTLNQEAPDVAPPSVNNVTDLNDEEFKTLVRARRTHIHSHAALAKLSELMVGELVEPTLEETDELIFSPHEYRRYALVSSTMETAGGSLNPIIRLKFCSLYPFDTRANEPLFLPGTAVEIQCRIDGEFVSRYYTPVNGTPTSFEICVKVVTMGKMSSYLSNQKPGDRQYKIRGPVGKSILDPQRPLSETSDAWAFNNLIFVAGGSGFAPLLQFLRTMFLPSFVPIFVRQQYLPAADDELELLPGDWVLVQEHLYDGWAVGVNLRTNFSGIFPLPVTIPYCGPNAKITIVNCARSPCEVFGQNILSGVMLAYPEHITVHHFFSRGIPDGIPEQDLSYMAPGYHSNSRLSAPSLEQIILQDAQWDVNGSPETQKIIVCGSQGLEGTVYDALTDNLGIHQEFIKMLSPTTLE